MSVSDCPCGKEKKDPYALVGSGCWAKVPKEIRELIRFGKTKDQRRGASRAAIAFLFG